MMQAECGRITARPVVIAAYRDSAKFSGQINHFIGICTITDNIAEIPYHVVFWRRGKNSLKSWEIRVDVGYDKRTHLSFSFALSLYSVPLGPVGISLLRPHASVSCSKPGTSRRRGQAKPSGEAGYDWLVRP